MVRRDRPGRDLASPRRDHRADPAGSAHPAVEQPTRHHARRTAGRDRCDRARDTGRCGRSCRAGSRSCLRRFAASYGRRTTHPASATFVASSAGTSAGGSLHRTTGLFVTAGFVHGVLDGTPFHHSPLLRWSYVAVGAVGVAFYVYRELLARFFLSLHDYQVEAVRAIDGSLVEVALRPIGRSVDFVPGQFAMVYLEAKDGWHRHPVHHLQRSARGGPPGHRQGTRRLHGASAGADRARHARRHRRPARTLQPLEGNRPAGLDRRRRRRRTVSELAPCAQRSVATSVDFYYSADGTPPFADEIRTIADRHPSLHAHLIDTSVDGRLTTERVLSAAAGDRRELSVFMCGPQGMLRTFQTQLRLAGVPQRQIHREYFDWRYGGER